MTEYKIDPIPLCAANRASWIRALRLYD